MSDPDYTGARAALEQIATNATRGIDPEDFDARDDAEGRAIRAMDARGYDFISAAEISDAVSDAVHRRPER
jgi:hypothetical protein